MILSIYIVASMIFYARKVEGWAIKPEIRNFRSAVSGAELTEFATKIWNLDVNSASDGEVIIDIQNYAGSSGSDQSPAPLFQSVSPDLLAKPTFSKMSALFKNYNPYTRNLETKTATQQAQEQDFVQEMMKTSIMQETVALLIEKRYVDSQDEFEERFYTMWFELYSRGSYDIIDSCGFEHVFVGEIDTSKNTVTGFHGWLSFYEKEKTDLDYWGWVGSGLKDPHIMGTKFTYLGYLKSFSSIWVGRSPEFEMAMFTVCFFVRTDVTCRFDIDDQTVEVTTWTLSGNINYVGTAYARA